MQSQVDLATHEGSTNMANIPHKGCLDILFFAPQIVSVLWLSCASTDTIAPIVIALRDKP